MPTVMLERGAATQYPRGMKAVSTAKTLALEDKINTHLSLCSRSLSFFGGLFHFCRSRHNVSTFNPDLMVGEQNANLVRLTVLTLAVALDMMKGYC